MFGLWIVLCVCYVFVVCRMFGGNGRAGFVVCVSDCICVVFFIVFVCVIVICYVCVVLS